MINTKLLELLFEISKINGDFVGFIGWLKS